MFFSVKRAGGGPGLDPDIMPKSIVNRVGTDLRVGEILMLDFDNQSYDETADITGCFGNGVTPASTSPSTSNAYAYLLYPMFLVQGMPRGGASGEWVDGIWHGMGTSIQTNSGAVAATIASMGRIASPLTRIMDVYNSTTLATIRTCMFNRTLHTVGTGEENIRGYFCGLDGK